MSAQRSFCSFSRSSIRNCGRFFGTAILVALFCTLPNSWLRNAHAQGVPVSIPIKFGADPIVGFSVTIERYRNYFLNLIFLFEDQRERRSARKIAGDAKGFCEQQNDCGKAARFHVTIKKGDNIILKQDTKSYGTYGFTAKAFLRNILIAPLKPASYDIELAVIEFDPGIGDVKTGIELTTDPRAGDLGP